MEALVVLAWLTACLSPQAHSISRQKISHTTKASHKIRPIRSFARKGKEPGFINERPVTLKISRIVKVQGMEAGGGGLAMPEPGKSTPPPSSSYIGSSSGNEEPVPMLLDSRIFRWRVMQGCEWDLSRVEPLQVDPVTNKTRILMFMPHRSMEKRWREDIDECLDLDRIELLQIRNYADAMKHIKDFKPHVITMDYVSAPSGFPDVEILPAEPVAEEIQKAIDEKEIEVQYFLIVGANFRMSRNLAINVQTDGWMLRNTFAKWIALPRKDGYFDKELDDMEQYWKDVRNNTEIEVPELYKSWLPKRHFDDPAAEAEVWKVQ